MKAAILFLAVLGAASATLTERSYSLSDLTQNVYFQGISDMVLGWTDPQLSDVCEQKLPSLMTKERQFWASFLTFDFAQIEAAFGSLYNSYVTLPQCSYTTNVITSAGYIFVVTFIYKALYDVNTQVAYAFAVVSQIFYNFTAGLENFIQTAYVIISSYSLLTDYANTSTQQVAAILGYVVRLFLLSLFFDSPQAIIF